MQLGTPSRSLRSTTRKSANRIDSPVRRAEASMTFLAYSGTVPFVVQEMIFRSSLNAQFQQFANGFVPADRSRRASRIRSAAFDSLVGQYVQQLVRRIPLTQSRKNKLENKRFHNLQAVANELKDIFDIDILDGLNAGGIDFAKRMFHRRHVYEHKGGEADEKYISDSGDDSVRPKQAIRETQESAHRIAGLVMRMASNLHNGFHGILPPEPSPIQQHQRLRRKSESP